jgi:Carboxypeptidase regulatory-like domain
MPMIRALFVAVSAWFLALSIGASEHIVQVDHTGRSVATSEMPQSIAPGEAVWVWSDECFPRRLEVLPAGDCVETREIVIHVVASARRPTAALEIRWGTEEMLHELPDALLPLALVDDHGGSTIRVPDGVPVYARIAGPTLASRWTELHAPATPLLAVTAVPVNILLRDPAGIDALRGRLEIRTTDVESPHGLAFRGAGDGVVSMPPVPAGAYVRLLAWSETRAPVIVTGKTDRLPAAVSLKPGVGLRGKLIDRKKVPVPAAQLSAVFLVPPAGAIEKRVRSDKQGVFVFEGLEAREVEWSVHKTGFGRLSRIATLKGDFDLGEIVLSPSRNVRVSVVNRHKEPIAGALIRTSDGIEGKSNPQGIATLKLVPSDAFNASALGFGYLPHEFRVPQEGGNPPIVVVLRDAARVRARIVRASDGAPLGPGSVAIQLDGRQSLAEFGSDGEIDIANLTEGKLSLEIRGPGVSPYRLPERRIMEGELVDLGRLPLSPGLTISGRVVDGTSSGPLSGASIHVLRPSTFGPLLSYARQDWAMAETSTEGAFQVTGLAPAVYSLWIEAAGHAPLIRTGLQLGGAEPDFRLDLGDLVLPAGKTLDLVCEPVVRCGTRASLLIAEADWMPLSAPMADGTASIAPVPPGQATLRLSDERGVINERDVTVSGDEPVTHLHIRLASVNVSGVVTRGGKQVTEGTLLFRPSARAERLVQIEHTVSSGSMGSDFLGTVIRAYSAEISEDGRFSLQNVIPDEYAVTWSAGAAQSPPTRVSILDETATTLAIDLPGGAVVGVVRMPDGAPLPPSLFVIAEQVGGQGQTFVAPDGTFSIAGLTPGTVTVRAHSRKWSAERSLTVEERTTAHVELMLQPVQNRSLEVTVRANGAPLPNAVVFLRENGATTAATTAADGTASLALSRTDGTIEAAVYSPQVGWAFVPPQSEATATALSIDVVPSSAAIDVTAAIGRKPVSILAPTGFPIHEALAFLGIPSVTPLRLEHVPAGTYSFTSGGVRKMIDPAQKGNVEF